MTKVTRLTLDDDGNMKSRRIHLREISGDSDTPLETVGQDLRAARLRRGDDLATVSKALKIRKDHLEAIEEDRLEQLPGRTYAVGFVRTYADYLGLDAAQTVERFKAEIAGRSDSDTTPPVTVIDEDEHRRLPQGWKIVAGVVVLAMLYAAYYVLTSTNTMTSQPVAAPPPQLVPKPVAAAPAALPAPTTPQIAPPPAALTSPPAATPGAAPLPLPGGTAPATAPATAPVAPAVEAPLPQGQVYGSANHSARVVLRVHQPARILVQGVDGMVYINRTLQPGDTYQLPNIVGLTLTTTNAKAVEVDLDGQSMGYAGKEPAMVEALSLDPQSIVDRSNGGSGQ
ncbi:MAG TPA: RodZ domain-containing protein [Rhizomicrobium sp.]|jgi:cytoskeleton protein RodZ|nr:RodZ domain-containing protein [Rhizomicrobium sp.]